MLFSKHLLNFVDANSTKFSPSSGNLGLSVRFADMPGKSRKKKKNIKELTPLQAMMLRMAGKVVKE